MAAFQRQYDNDHSWEDLQEDEFGRLLSLVTFCEALELKAITYYRRHVVIYFKASPASAAVLSITTPPPFHRTLPEILQRTAALV